MDNKTCETCGYLYEWFMVCCNGESPYCADIVESDWACDGWFDRNEKDWTKEVKDWAKEVEEQLG